MILGLGVSEMELNAKVGHTIGKAANAIWSYTDADIALFASS